MIKVNKTVRVCFLKQPCRISEPDIVFSWQKLQIVKIKYLGVWIDSNLSFGTHVRKMSQQVRFSLSNFRFIRN